jgi:hypothetical protein
VKEIVVLEPLDAAELATFKPATAIWGLRPFIWPQATILLFNMKWTIPSQAATRMPGLAEVILGKKMV